MGCPSVRAAVSVLWPATYDTTQPGPEPPAPMPDLLIAVTIGPLTRPCADIVRRTLIERGWPILSFSVGTGQAMEQMVLSGKIHAVLDLTLTELAAEMLGVWGGAGPDRLTAAGLRSIPQVIALGGLEVVDERPTTPE